MKTLLDRPGLSKSLAGTPGLRLVVLYAAGGAGKTVLLEGLARRPEAVLYCATSRDASSSVLAAGLLRVMRDVVPGLSDDVANGLAFAPASVVGEDPARRAVLLAGLLCEALERHVTAELTVLIDDADLIPANAPSWQLLDILLREAPEGLRFVIAARLPLPFAVERLRRHTGVVQLGDEELAFTEEETQTVLERWLDADCSLLAPAVHAATDGRPGAVRLAAELLAGLPAEERTQAAAELPSATAGLGGLAGEVLAGKPLAVRELLRTSVCLERFTVELCEHLGQMQAAQVLPGLAAAGPFVARTPDRAGWFAVTRFGRDLLETQFTLDFWEREAILRRAAEWLETHGDPVAAVSCLQAAGAGEDLAAALVRCGDELLGHGYDDALLSAAVRVPTTERTPELELLVGTALQRQAAPDDALAAFHRAAAEQHELPAVLALRIGLVHHFRGDLDGALAAYGRGRLDGSAPADEAELLAWTASARWLRGEREVCRELAEAAMARATSSGDAGAFAAAHTALALAAALDGDRLGNDAHYLRALEHAERAGDLVQVARIRTNRSSRYLEEGSFFEAEQEAGWAIVLAEVAGVDWFRALALSNRGEARWWLGRLEGAVADLETARDLYERLGSRTVAYPLTKLADVLRERGDVALARLAYEEALRYSEEIHDLQGLVPALAGMAEILASEDLDAAAELAERAVSYRHGMSHVHALLAAGRVALARGETERAVSRAREAAAEARGRRDRPGVAAALELRALATADPGPLAEAERIWTDLAVPLGQARAELIRAVLDGGHPDALAQAETRLLELGSRWRPPTAIAATHTAAPLVEIRSLGGFRVLRKGQPVPPTAWQSKKARDLLKLLVARRGRPVPRDVLMDVLWPEEDPGRIGNRLSVTLSTVRAVLDPDKQHSADHFLAADKSAVWLEVARCAVDVEEFLADAGEGLALRQQGRAAEAARHLSRAQALYQGDFLEEDPYSDWAVALREEARALYIVLTRALAEDAAKAGDHELAARYQRRVLERDPYDERAHLALVAVLVAAGRHGEAHRCYRTYIARMSELGIEARPFPAGSSRPVTQPAP